jgi:branched-chain amino acid transport system permease protein
LRDRIRSGFIIILISAIPLLIEGTKYRYIISLLTLIGIFGIMIIGFDMLVGYSGQFSIAHPAFFGIGAYGSGLLTTKCNFPPLISLLASLLLTLVISYILGFSTLRFRHFYLILVTLAFGEIFFRFLLGAPSITGGPAGIFLKPFSILGFQFDSDFKFYYLTWIIAIILYLIAKNLVNSRWGRALIALSDDDTAAGCMGVNITQHKIQVFVISCGYASVGGSLFAHFQNFVTPIQFSVHAALDFVLMIFIGGVRTLWGGFIGVAVMKIIPDALEWLKDYRSLFSGILLILILIFMPKGIAGLLTEIWKNSLVGFKNLFRSVMGKRKCK